MVRVHKHTSEGDLGTKASPKMPRTRNKAVAKVNGPVPHNKSVSGEPRMPEHCRVLKEGFEEINK